MGCSFMLHAPRSPFAHGVAIFFIALLFILVHDHDSSRAVQHEMDAIAVELRPVESLLSLALPSSSSHLALSWSIVLPLASIVHRRCDDVRPSVMTMPHLLSAYRSIDAMIEAWQAASSLTLLIE